jgi:hypothetical protein
MPPSQELVGELLGARASFDQARQKSLVRLRDHGLVGAAEVASPLRLRALRLDELDRVVGGVPFQGPAALPAPEPQPRRNPGRARARKLARPEGLEPPTPRFEAYLAVGDSRRRAARLSHASA